MRDTLAFLDSIKKFKSEEEQFKILNLVLLI